MQALLALEDGRTFPCRSFTGAGETSGEVVFNTGMTGYQEILTDPSYRGQIVTMTYPLIGNYGVNPEDIESDRIQVAGFVLREYQDYPSNFRSTQSLADYLRQNQILGVSELDTRALTRHIRTAGAMRVAISTEELDPERLVQQARQVPPMEGCNLVQRVTSRQAYSWSGGQAHTLASCEVVSDALWRPEADGFRVVAFDFGIKYNILRWLAKSNCQIIVVPAETPAEVVKALKPDGIFLSNGPGDPEPVTRAIETVRELVGYKPLFGICLGVQILGLALGGRTYKLKFGHRGANQPVLQVKTGKVEITSQNHGFAVDPKSLPASDIEVTHINLNDNTLEGFAHRNLPLFAVQYHPEASPGPHDARYLFDQFVAHMAAEKP